MLGQDKNMDRARKTGFGEMPWKYGFRGCFSHQGCETDPEQITTRVAGCLHGIHTGCVKTFFAVARYFPARPVAKRGIYLGVGQRKRWTSFDRCSSRDMKSVATSSTKDGRRGTSEGIFRTLSQIASAMRNWKLQARRQ